MAESEQEKERRETEDDFCFHDGLAERPLPRL